LKLIIYSIRANTFYTNNICDTFSHLIKINTLVSDCTQYMLLTISNKLLITSITKRQKLKYICRLQIKRIDKIDNAELKS